MLQQFKDFISQQHLFSPEQEVLLAVSGGRDSVCLVNLMSRAHFRFAIAHCNFHLRGSESDRDEAFVRSLARQLDVPFHVAQFDTASHAARSSQSIEEAARQLRYQWFASLCSQHGYSATATAHHRDDSVETFFLNLFRGTGLLGLHGIRPQVGNVVRPLLPFSRTQIDAYISRHALPFVDDSTNAQLDAQRNRIRLQLMPLLRQLYPSIDLTMAANIERLHQSGLIFAEHVALLRRQMVSSVKPRLPWVSLDILSVDLSLVQATPFASTLLYEFLRPFSFSSSDCADILRSLRTGSRFVSPTHVAVIDRGCLLVSSPPSPSCRPSIASRTVPSLDTSASAFSAFVDADKLRQPLSMRRWQPGDRFCPFGMHGRSKLVSDLLKDRHLNSFDKECVYLLCDADGRVVWVIGLAADDRFRVDHSTSSILRFDVSAL